MAAQTSLQAKTTATTAGNGTGVDVSGLAAGYWTLKLKIDALSPNAGTVRFQFTDSVDNFSSDKLAGPTVSCLGGEASNNPKTYSFNQYDFPDFRIGTASAKVRVDLTAINGTSPSVTYEAWIEQ